MEVDVLEFRVPVENNKTVFVWDIQPSLNEAQIYEELFALFSAFGPLYLLKVCPNAPLHPPGFYALIKFYSAAQASNAQRLTDGRPLFQNSVLKVKLSSKQTPYFHRSSLALSHARCLELANHYLGFNGWTSDIITLKELPSEEEEEEEEGGGGGEEEGVRQKTLKFGCLMKLSFPHHGLSTRGAAVLEDTFPGTGPEVVLQRRCRLQRQVRERALVQAFSSVLLVLLTTPSSSSSSSSSSADRKVMVELKPNPDQVGADDDDDDDEGILQVNEFFPPADEEEDEERCLPVADDASVHHQKE